MTKKRILIVGQEDKHLNSFISELNLVKNNYEVDFFNLGYTNNIKLFDRTFCLQKNFPRLFYKKYLTVILRMIDIVISYRKLQVKYHLINIHFVTIDSLLLLNSFKKSKAKILLTPWGSDVLRVNNSIIIFLLKRLYKAADYVSVSKIRFREDVVKKFSVDSSKLLDFGYGASNIDHILLNKLDVVSAKKQLELENKIIITCGYNRSKSQNHSLIIEQLGKVKETLPKNTVLMFPFTYNGSIEPYKSELITLLTNYNFEYRFLLDYMNADDICKLVLVTDLFIHIQETDANSASLQEFLLLKKAVINGKWLKYDNLEKYGVPYYLAESKDKLQDAVLEVLDNNFQSKVKDSHINEITSFGWKYKILQWDNFYSSL